MDWHEIALKIARDRWVPDCYQSFWRTAELAASGADARLAALGNCIAVAASYLEIQRRSVVEAISFLKENP